MRVSTMLRGMVFRLALAAFGLAAALTYGSQAQTAPSSPQTNPPAAQAPGPAQSATPPASLQLHDLPPDPHTPTAEEQEQRQQQAVVNAAMRLATLQANWGPRMDTPGLSVTLTEVGRAKTPEGTKITYQLAATGFPPDKRVMLLRWPLNAEARTVMGGIGFDAKGIAVCGDAAPAQPSAASGLSAAPPPAPGAGNEQPGFVPPPSCQATMQPNQPVQVEATVAPGEAIRVALTSEDRKQDAVASVVPFPIASADKGCRLQVILGMKNAAMVLIEATGFPPNTPLKFDVVTGDDTRTVHPRSNADGRMVFPLLPGAKGLTAGETTVKFSGINRQPLLDTSKETPQPAVDCAPAVSFHWGEGSYKVQ